MPTSGRRNRVNVAVHTNHHQRLRHLAAAMETTVQDILDRVLEPVSYTHLTLPTNREV